MENYTCTKRRMTKEEQVIAESNYRILNYYIYKKNLKPIEEWLERLSVPYVVAIMKYTDCADLQRYSIRTIIFYAFRMLGLNNEQRKETKESWKQVFAAWIWQQE